MFGFDPSPRFRLKFGARRGCPHVKLQDEYRYRAFVLDPRTSCPCELLRVTSILTEVRNGRLLVRVQLGEQKQQVRPGSWVWPTVLLRSITKNTPEFARRNSIQSNDVATILRGSCYLGIGSRSGGERSARFRPPPTRSVVWAMNYPDTPGCFRYGACGSTSSAGRRRDAPRTSTDPAPASRADDADIRTCLTP